MRHRAPSCTGTRPLPHGLPARILLHRGRRRLTAISLIVAAACGGGGDGGPSGPGQPTATPASVTLPGEAVTLYRGRSTTLVATVADARGIAVPGIRPAWSSSEPGVATVDAAGVVRAVGVGVATVRARVNALADSVRVTVEPMPVGRVTISGADTVWVGDTARVVAAVLDLDGAPLTDRAIAWAVSDPSIAEVTADGRVVGLQPGTVTLTAQADTARATRATVVTLVPLAEIRLSAPDSTVRVGGELTLTAMLRDARGRVVTDRAVEWTSADPAALSVASVTGSTAVVRATRAGPVRVDARAGEAEAEITVGAYRPGFATRLGTRFILDGEPYSFGGTNNYYLHYVAREETT